MSPLAFRCDCVQRRYVPTRAPNNLVFFGGLDYNCERIGVTPTLYSSCVSLLLWRRSPVACGLPLPCVPRLDVSWFVLPSDRM